MMSLYKLYQKALGFVGFFRRGEVLWHRRGVARPNVQKIHICQFCPRQGGLYMSQLYKWVTWELDTSQADTKRSFLTNFETLQTIRQNPSNGWINIQKNAGIPKKMSSLPSLSKIFKRMPTMTSSFLKIFSKKCKENHGKSLAWRHLQNQQESICCSDFFHRRELGSSWFLLGFFGGTDIFCVPLLGLAAAELVFKNPAAEKNELCQRLFQHTPRAHPRQSPKPIMKETPL